MAIAIFPAFGVIDDHTLIKTLFHTPPINIPFFVIPEIGRFYPLDGQDLNIVSSIFGANAYAFYIFNALMMIVVALCVRYVLKHIIGDSKWVYIVTIAFLLTPAFITSYLRLFVPERMEIVFFAIFLASYVRFLKKNEILYLCIGLISLNFALYYKEIAFLMAFAFAFFHLIFSIKDKNKNIKVFDGLIIVSSLVWLLVYYVVVLANKTTDGRYGESPYNQVLVFFKNLINYSLQEPFLVVLVGILIIYRVFVVFVKKHKVNAFLDSLLIASFVGILAYLKLNMYNFHYALPSYIFALGGIVGFVFKEQYIKNKLIKSVFVLCSICYIFNSLPASVYQFAHYKFVTNNFQDTLVFLDKYMKGKENLNIYLEGVDRISNGEVYVSFTEYLEYMGNDNFDFLSDVEVDNTYLWQGNKDSKYSALRSNAVVPKKEGDIVILTPYSFNFIDDKFMKEINSKYRLLHISDFGFNIPSMGIKSAIKYLTYKSNPNIENLLISNNIFQIPLYFYIYEVKKSQADVGGEKDGK